MGLAASAAAFGWVRALGEELSEVRFALLGVGMVGAMTAVWLQLRRPESCPSPAGQRLAAALVPLANALVALGAVVMVVLRVRVGEELRWLTGGETFFWVLVAGWTGFAAVYTYRRLGREGVTEGAESAAVLTLGALAVYLMCWALFLGGDRPEAWDSMRLFLSVLALVAFAAAPLAAASSRVRRRALSVLIVFHFGGIVTAAASSPPGPWAFSQLWLHFYRPYLEFMYLNNAYRFYSPEPTPSHQMWFRVEYHDKAADQVRSHWFRVPEMDEDGRPAYPVTLQYLRRLVMVEAASRAQPITVSDYLDPQGGVKQPDFLVRRYQQTPQGYRAIKDVLGKKPPKSDLEVPYLRHLIPPQDPRLGRPEYSPPDFNSKLLLQSYARYATRLPHPQYSDAQPVRVKIYRVQHWIVTPQELLKGLHPQDLTNFLFYYQGEYDTAGRLLDPEDPFLYWLLPAVRVNWGDPDSPILVYAYRHAGDRKEALRGPYKDGHKPLMKDRE
jgi:hypothetical protein